MLFIALFETAYAYNFLFFEGPMTSFIYFGMLKHRVQSEKNFQMQELMLLCLRAASLIGRWHTELMPMCIGVMDTVAIYLIMFLVEKMPWT